MKQYKDMTKKELIAVIAQKDDTILRLSEQVDSRGKLIDELRNPNLMAMTPDAAAGRTLELLYGFEPEEQNLILSKMLAQLSSNRHKTLRAGKEYFNRAQEQLSRCEESLSQFLTVANAGKYAGSVNA